jgi:hypothetical protein
MAAGSARLNHHVLCLMSILAVAMACSICLFGYGINVQTFMATESMEHWWNDSGREKLRFLEKSVPVPQV